ncbi:MAG: NUDIX domain-containing protein [Bacteroidales bacterium]|nr:NUDIX domain-containing protein [Bacteroidales bacterium]
MYKVYINNGLIQFSKEHFANPQSRLQNYKDLDKSELNRMISVIFHSGSSESIQIQAENPLTAFNNFIDRFTIVEASGGLIRNDNQQFLFIYRNERWDLPKGHIDPGESPETTALREIKEETAVEGLRIIKKLPQTYHMYYLKNKWIVKRNYWFECHASSSQILIPQEDEGITKVEWLDKDQIKSIREQSWSSLHQIIDIALKESASLK